MMNRMKFVVLSSLGLIMGLPQEEKESKWVPQCWCGLAGDDVAEIGEGVWKCRDRHAFVEPWATPGKDDE